MTNSERERFRAIAAKVTELVDGIQALAECARAIVQELEQWSGVLPPDEEVSENTEVIH